MKCERPTGPFHHPPTPFFYSNYLSKQSEYEPTPQLHSHIPPHLPFSPFCTQTGFIAQREKMAATRQRHVRLPVDCPICARPSLYNYYNVRSCESCKQFFRRAVIGKLDFVCGRDGRCQIQKRERCNSCRLDRCLRAGMNPLLVNLPNVEKMGQFLMKLMERRNGAERRQPSPAAEKSPPLDCQELMPDGHFKLLSGDFQLVNSLLYLESRQRMVWRCATEHPIAYLDGFNSIEDLLRHPGNILAKAEQLQNVSQANWDKESYVAECDQFGIGIPTNFDYLTIDRLLLVEMAKALPFFRRLELKDQIVLLRHISMPIAILLNAYYSASNGADTWTRANGLTFISGYQNKRFRGDEKVAHLVHKKLCSSVAHVKQTGVDRDEFILLMVILYCSSTAENLSDLAKDLLYSESVRYSRTLLNLLQHKHGPGPGANKYAQQIHLLELMFGMEYVTQMLVTYLDAFHFNQIPLTSPSIPKALLPIIF